MIVNFFDRKEVLSHLNIFENENDGGGKTFAIFYFVGLWPRGIKMNDVRCRLRGDTSRRLNYREILMRRFALRRFDTDDEL